MVTRPPQILTPESLVIGLIFGAKMATCPDFKVLYNSVGAWSSVNHLHFHGVFISNIFEDNRMPIESRPIAEVVKIVPCGSSVIIVSIIEYEVKCFKFTLCPLGGATAHVKEKNLAWYKSEIQCSNTNNLMKLRDEVWCLCDELLRLDLPHNLLITDGGCTVYVFPRKIQKPSRMNKPKNGLLDRTGELHIAVVELSGLILCRDEMTFISISEMDFIEMLQADVALSNDVFQNLKSTIGKKTKMDNCESELKCDI